MTIFKNTEILAEMTQPHDEPILESLRDINVSFPDNFPDNSMGFVLEFVFAENEFFEEKVLTKTYHMKSEPDEFDPVAFDGPEIIGCTGCTINWMKGWSCIRKVNLQILNQFYNLKTIMFNMFLQMHSHVNVFI